MITPCPGGNDMRYLFQWHHAQAPILNVGCESDPVHFGHVSGTVNMDIDLWPEVPGFRQVDACVAPWPFADGQFETVVFGDSLDHMERPEVALAEARRVARGRVVATLPKDPPVEKDRWEDHVGDLGTAGLKATAEGDLEKRHSHRVHWTEDRVRELFAGFPCMEVVSLRSGLAKDPRWYWGIFLPLGHPLAPAAPPVQPRLSVLLCTYRPGGLDVAFSGLSRQNYTGPWEVVLIDELHCSADRRAAVRRAAERWPVADLRHLANPRSLWPRCSTARAHNEAILRADGDVAIWLADYASVRPDFLAQHAALHMAGGDGLVVNGAFYNAWPPRVASGLAKGLPMNPFSQHLWGLESIFEYPCTPEVAWVLPLQNRTDEGKGWTRGNTGQDEASTRFVDGSVHWEYYFMKHDSVSLRLLRELGGNDESFDGLHARHDSELGLRLAAAGARFHHSKRPAIRLVQVRALMGRLSIEEDADRRGLELMGDTHRRVAAGIAWPRQTHPDLEKP